VEVEEEGAGWRGFYEGALNGGVVELGESNESEASWSITHHASHRTCKKKY
jgi:hypothetical protein